ncbi:MAG: DUF2905 domain-containing protein [Candidatus Solibacter usitatus]|nr:DUF2905 domain-containing protein [Candidatus Solibacter usitatus]
MSVPAVARILMLAGAALLAAGLLLLLSARLPFRLGHLPGDIVIRGRNSTFYFPVVTCLLLSLALSVLVCSSAGGEPPQRTTPTRSGGQ